MSHFIMTEQDCNQEYNSGLNTYHNLYIYKHIYMYTRSMYLVIHVKN